MDKQIDKQIDQTITISSDTAAKNSSQESPNMLIEEYKVEV